MTYVKNASGTSRWSKPSTGESSWLEYWENHTGKKATRCGATDCHSTGTLVGGHVQKVSGVMKSTSPLCAKAATIAQTISGLTPNWLEYQADCKPVHDMQRLKRSVAESEGHRIVFHNLSLTVMRKEIHIVSNPNRGGWDAKNLTQTGLQSTLIQRRKQWSGVATWQRGKGLNLFLTAQMVRFKIPTAMEITHVHPRTPGIKHFSLIE